MIFVNLFKAHFQNENQVTLPLSLNEPANDLATKAETISRKLKFFEEKKHIKKTKKY
ncbi:cyclic nucleotide-binding domain protein [Streptococcus troglodytae]|uniref:Cyclic nucleotide-binding domain protein n=1 Tax=Streptococcus troglodytae TaxID=1111760 RepID=A0A1L7LH15_9STRE|nr:cyclic nucleotide-binding domain protein [Streptococcus troglodytae]